MTIKLSVLLPTYNRDFLLQEALYSITQNKRSDIEFVVIDNASTDNTQDVIKKFANTDKRVKNIKNIVNLGPNRTIFRGCIEVESKFILILCDDTTVTDGFFDEVIDYLDKYPNIGCAYCQLFFPDPSYSSGYREKKVVSNTTLFKEGCSEGVKVMLESSGQIPGVILNLNCIFFDHWRLDNDIYPQVRAMGFISLNYASLYVCSKEGIVVKDDPRDSNVDVIKRRPLDMGIFERIDHYWDITRHLKNNKNSTFFKLKRGAIQWAFSTCEIIYKENEVFSWEVFVNLVSYQRFSNSPYFLIRFIADGFKFKLKFFYIFILGLILAFRSLFSIFFYKELCFYFLLLFEKRSKVLSNFNLLKR